MAKVRHLHGDGIPAGSSLFTFTAQDFNDLTLVVAPQPVEAGTLAYVFNSQGTAWLPGTIGGSYYPAGIYVSDGLTWTSDRNAIATELDSLINTKANISDLGAVAFSNDYNDLDNKPDFEDIQSGVNFIPALETFTVNANREMIVSSLTIDGTLIVDGTLTLLF